MSTILSPKDQRNRFRNNQDIKNTSGMCPGYQHSNIVIIQKKYAFDFLLFCLKNPKSCPIIDVMEEGIFEPSVAKNADIRTDAGMYRVYEYGKLTEETSDILKYWQDDFVTFLLGCSITFENALKRHGIELLHEKENKFLAMYITNIKCNKSGIFSGNTVVSMRPIRKDNLMKTIKTTSSLPQAHGSPIHIGDPKIIGINNLNQPDFGEYVHFGNDYIPVFWACGVTPQVIAMKSKPEIMITHSPGHMFITDKKETDPAILY